MKKIVSTVIALTLALTAFAADSGKTLMAQARKLEAAKKWQQAYDIYMKAAAAFKTTRDKYTATSKAAVMMSRQKKYAEARKLLLSVAKDPKFDKTSRTFAYQACVRTTSDKKQRIAFLDAAIALQCGNWPEASCRNGRAAELVSIKRYAEGKKEYMTVINNPKYPMASKQIAYMGLARLAAAQKDYAAGHKYCAEYLKVSKRPSYDIINLKATLFMAEKKYKEALDCYWSIISSGKFSKHSRSRAMQSAIETYYITMNDPMAARAFLEKCAVFKLPTTGRVRVITRDIKALLDEE